MKKGKLAYWLFFGTFTLLLLVGVGLTVFSVATVPNQGPSTLEWAMEGQKFNFKLTTGIPGLIITSFGFLGLLTLLIKVPIRELLPRPTMEKDGYTIAQSLGQYYPKVSYQWLIGAKKKVPLLFYWLFYRNAPYVRAKDGLP